jgi:repressor LexA
MSYCLLARVSTSQLIFAGRTGTGCGRKRGILAALDGLRMAVLVNLLMSRVPSAGSCSACGISFDALYLRCIQVVLRAANGNVMHPDEPEYGDLIRAKTQQTVLVKILELSPDGTRSPTIHELTLSLGKAADSNISRALDGLEQKKYIQRDRVNSTAAQARGIWLTKRGFDWLTSQGKDTSRYTRVILAPTDIRAVPVLGEIGAGNPRATDSSIPDGNIQDYLPLPAQNLPIGPVFGLNVVGDSMVGDGILDGDQVLVVPYSKPMGDGEVVVALVDGDATVKRLTRDGQAYWLHPSNPDFEPKKYVSGDDFYIQGRVIGVVRWSIK